MIKIHVAQNAELSDADLETVAGGMRWYPDDKETKNFDDLRGQGKAPKPTQPPKKDPPKKEVKDSMDWYGFGTGA